MEIFQRFIFGKRHWIVGNVVLYGVHCVNYLKKRQIVAVPLILVKFILIDKFFTTVEIPNGLLIQ